jgi:hypothetical protein
MLRSYKDYKNTKPLRRNSNGDINLVRDLNGNYCILSTLILSSEDIVTAAEKSRLYNMLSHPNVDKTLDVFLSQTHCTPFAIQHSMSLR